MFIGIGTRLRSYPRKGQGPIPPPVPGPDDFIDKNTDLTEVIHEFSTADNCIAFGVVVHRGTSSDLHATYDGIELERAVSEYNPDANIEVIIFYSNTATIGDGEFRLYCDTGEFGPVHVRLNEGEGFFYPELSFTGHNQGEAGFPPEMTVDNPFSGKIKALTGYDRYDLSSAGILPQTLTIGFRWASAWGTEIPGFDYSWENWTIPANVAEINSDGDLEFTGYGRVDISFPTGVLADPAIDVGMDVVQNSIAFYGTRGTSARGYSFAAPVEYESFTMALGYGDDDCDGVRITSYPGNIVKMNSLTALDGVMSSLFVSGPSSDGLQIAFRLKSLVKYAQAAAQFLFGWQYLVDKSYNANDYSCYQSTMATDRADEIGDPIGLYLTSPRDMRGIANLLTGSDALATQTVTTTAQEYTLKFSGSGDVTLSGSASSGPLSAGTHTFIASDGALTITVSGTVTEAQLNAGETALDYQRNGVYLGGPGDHFGQATSAARPTLGQVPKGIGIVNRVRNGMVGADSSTLPESWVVQGTPNGVNRSYTIGTHEGRSYLDITFSGTPSATASVGVYFCGASQVAAANGQPWTTSAYVATVGALTGVNRVDLTLLGRSSGGTAVESSFLDVTASLNSSLNRFSHSFTFNNADTAFVQPGLRIQYTSGVAVSATIRIWLPMLNAGATAADPQYTPTPYDITQEGVPSVQIPYFGGSHWLTMGKPAAFNGCDYFVDGAYNFAWGFVFCSTGSGVIVACGGATEASRKLGVSLTSGDLQVVCRGAVTATSGTDYADGLPHVGLLVVIGTDVKLYVDRNAPITVTVGSASNEATQQLLIGARDSTSPGGHYTGFADLTLNHIGLISTEEIEEWIEGECERVGVPV